MKTMLMESLRGQWSLLWDDRVVANKPLALHWGALSLRKKLSESVFLSNDQYVEFLILKFLCSLSLASVHGESRPYCFMALIKLLTKMEHFSNVGIFAGTTNIFWMVSQSPRRGFPKAPCVNFPSPEQPPVVQAGLSSVTVPSKIIAWPWKCSH